MPPLIFKLFQVVQFLFGFSIVFQRGRDKEYNVDKFFKQFGQFVYQNNCNLRQFGWQISVSINTVILGLSNIFFFRRCVVRHCEVAKQFFFACNWTVNFDIFDCFSDTKKWLIHRHNGGGWKNVDQRGPCPGKTVESREMFEQRVLNELEELWIK